MRVQRFSRLLSPCRQERRAVLLLLNVVVIDVIVVNDVSDA